MFFLNVVQYLCDQVSNVFAKFNTMTLSKFSGQVEEARRPSLFSFLQISRPSVSRSTMKHVMPLYPYRWKGHDDDDNDKSRSSFMRSMRRQKGGFLQRMGPRWPSPGKPLHAPRYWSTSWIHWWHNSLYVSQRASSGKKHHFQPQLLKGRSFQSVWCKISNITFWLCLH